MSNKIKKVLFSGCSHTANSGFDKNFDKHWVRLVANHYNFNYDNIAIGGMSNDEIFYRTVEAITTNKPDLVITLWTNIGRHWVYFDDPNIDDFSMVNPNIAGFNSDSINLKNYAKLYNTFFVNRYVLLKRWLLQCILLQTLFEKEDINYCFIRAYDNLLSDWRNIDSDNLFCSLSEDLKQILDFHGKPDYYIQQKISEIDILLNKLDNSKWLNLNTPSFNEMSEPGDVADDGRHIGEIGNMRLSKLLIASNII